MTKKLIIILGYTLTKDCQIQAILKSRLDHGLSVYKTGDKFLLCGKMPPQSIAPNRCDKFTEAEAMRQYLIANSISENYIIKEEQSTTTFGNAFYGYNFIQTEAPKKILIIANEFHHPVIEYSFTKVLGNNYDYDYAIIPDHSLNIPMEEIQKWKEIGKRMINNFFPLLFNNVEDGDIKTLASIIDGPVNQEFEQYVRGLLNIDESADIRDFICGNSKGINYA